MQVSHGSFVERWEDSSLGRTAWYRQNHHCQALLRAAPGRRRHPFPDVRLFGDDIASDVL